MGVGLNKLRLDLVAKIYFKNSVRDMIEFLNLLGLNFDF